MSRHDAWKDSYDNWKLASPYDEQDDPDEPEPEPVENVTLDISQISPDYFNCVDAQNYDGPGDICGTGRSREEAAADWAEQYADRVAQRALTEAYDEINALGGTSAGRGRKFWAAFGFNNAIDKALEILLARGALTVAQRRQRNDR
jgi:hypothetical protein